MDNSKFDLMRVISRFSVTTRVLMLSLVPMLGMLILGGNHMLLKREAVAQAELVLRIADKMPAISELVHQLQIERGMSAGFISSRGVKFVDALPEQRLTTVGVFGEFNATFDEETLSLLSGEVASYVSSIRGNMLEIEQARTKVSKLEISVGDMAAIYTGVIADLLMTVEVSIFQVQDAEVTRQMIALVAFLNGKERAGIERAIGTAVFAKGRMDQLNYIKLVDLMAKQNVMFDEFNTFGREDLGEYFEETLSGPEVERVEYLRGVLLGAPFGGSLASVSGEEWFGATTARIELLKNIDDRATKDLVSFVLEIKQKFTNQLIIALLFTALLLALTSVIAFVVIRSIAGPIVRLTKTMLTLSSGDNSVEVSGIENHDEIGEMARAVQVFKENAQKMSQMHTEDEKRVEQARLRAKAMTGLIRSLCSAVDAAVVGDFSKRIDVKLSDEDLAGVANNVNTLLGSVERGLTETGDVLGALANTDLTKRVTGDYQGAFLDLKKDTNAVADRISEIVTQLRQTSGELKITTGEILEGANDLSERTTKQAATIEETSATMEQLSTTVLENSKMAETVGENASGVAAAAVEGGQVMVQTTEAMERITSSSAKISNIIGMIDDIAFQTNLLALNASVEAARAGEAGKGFAVVAVEVRRLAQSAASASSEVKVLIDQSAIEVDQGSKLVALASEKLKVMMAGAEKNKTIMGEVVAANKEQASSIDEVNVAVRQMDEMTQNNAALVEETHAAIEQTDGQVTELDRIIDVFKLGQTGARMRASAARNSESTAPVPVVKQMQAKVELAAKSYLSEGGAALDSEWDEF